MSECPICGVECEQKIVTHDKKHPNGRTYTTKWRECSDCGTEYATSEELGANAASYMAAELQ